MTNLATLLVEHLTASIMKKTLVCVMIMKRSCGSTCTTTETRTSRVGCLMISLITPITTNLATTQTLTTTTLLKKSSCSEYFHFYYFMLFNFIILFYSILLFYFIQFYYFYIIYFYKSCLIKIIKTIALKHLEIKLKGLKFQKMNR